MNTVSRLVAGALIVSVGMIQNHASADATGATIVSINVINDGELVVEFDREICTGKTWGLIWATQTQVVQGVRASAQGVDMLTSMALAAYLSASKVNVVAASPTNGSSNCVLSGIRIRR